MRCPRLFVVVGAMVAMTASVAADEPMPSVTLEAEVQDTPGWRFPTMRVWLIGVKECAVITDELYVAVTRDGKKATITITLPEKKDSKGRRIVPSASKLGIVQLQTGEVARAHTPINTDPLIDTVKDACAGKIELVVQYEVPELWAKRFKVVSGKVRATATVVKK